MTLLFVVLLSLVIMSSCEALSTQTIALITGANKGIGYEIVRRLSQDSNITCILGCRNMDLGKKAIESLNKEGCKNLDLVEIDLEKVDTHDEVARYILETYGKCDILVNNAAVCFNDSTLYGKVPHTPFEKQAEITVATNFFGTLSLTEKLLPLLEKSSSPRIINIASSAGRLSILPSEERRQSFSSNDLSIDKLKDFMNEFVQDAQNGNHVENGWPNTGYGVSKVGIIAMTKILARTYPNMMVNSVDPGYCRTDQNDNQGFVPPERGALTPYLLATIDGEKQFTTGNHWYEEQAISWMYQ